MLRSIEFYNGEVRRWIASDKRTPVDDFVKYDDANIGWSRDLKADLKRGRLAEFDEAKLRQSLYRPFTQPNLFLDRILNEEVYSFPKYLPDASSEEENRIICSPSAGARASYWALCTRLIPNLALTSIDAAQCFPFYTYAEDGTHRRENITDWALEQFRSHYRDPSITKWDIFHYIYAVLHHPEYRERYAANLRRELPRIRFASAGAKALEKTPNDAALKRRSSTASLQNDRATANDGIRVNDSATVEERPFRAALARKESRALAPDGPVVAVKDADVFRELVKAGRRLAEIHVHYEQQPEYPLKKTEKAGEKLDYRVTKMRLSKDKTSLIYNQFLTLSEIPKETYDYRLGNRSALEWVIDQYQVSTDKRSGITNDPNRADDPQYILRLIGQVITVSLETVKIVRVLPALGIPGNSGGELVS